MRSKVLLATVLLLVVSVFAGTSVRAIDFIIDGNGSNSSSGIWFNNNNSTNVYQNNNGSVNNNVDANANTGGNSTSNNNGNSSIKTGDANVNVNITNTLNSNSATVNNCCTTPTPTLKPGQPTPTTKPGDPTPTSKPGDNNGNGGNGSSGSGSAIGGGQVMGLAATSGEPLTEYLFYAVAVLCLLVARKLFRSNGLAK